MGHPTKLNHALMIVAVGVAGTVLTGAAQADSQWQDQVSNVRGVQHYFTERCIAFAANVSVKYSFKSPQPVDFNIHYHTPGKPVGFTANEKSLTEQTGGFHTDIAREYCFTWTNPQDTEIESWDVTWSYSVSPAPKSPAPASR